MEGIEAGRTDRPRHPARHRERRRFDRHAFVDGIARRSASPRACRSRSRRHCGDVHHPRGHARMSFSDGTPYVVESASVTTSGGTPTGTINVRAVEGHRGNAHRGRRAHLRDGAVRVQPHGRGGERASARHRRGERRGLGAHHRAPARTPQSGNRADWANWAEAYTGTEITQTFVYPLLAPPRRSQARHCEHAGCVTVVAVGPAQGDSTTNTRIVPDRRRSRNRGAQPRASRTHRGRPPA